MRLLDRVSWVCLASTYLSCVVISLFIMHTVNTRGDEINVKIDRDIKRHKDQK